MSGYMSSDPGYNAGSCGGQEYGYGYDACMESCEGGSQWFGGVYGLYMTRSATRYQRYTAGVDSTATGTPVFSAAERHREPERLPLPRARLARRRRNPLGLHVWHRRRLRLRRLRRLRSVQLRSTAAATPAATTLAAVSPCCHRQMYRLGSCLVGTSIDDVQEQFVDGPVVGTFRYYGMINYAGLEYDPGTGIRAGQQFLQLPSSDHRHGHRDGACTASADKLLGSEFRAQLHAAAALHRRLRLRLLTARPSRSPACAACATSAWTTTSNSAPSGHVGGQPFDGWRNGTNELFNAIQHGEQSRRFPARREHELLRRVPLEFLLGLELRRLQQLHHPESADLQPAQWPRDLHAGRPRRRPSTRTKTTSRSSAKCGSAAGTLFTNHWRGILAYRAIGISGVGLATDQIKPEYSNWADTARINSDGSIIIHGVQAGIECIY